LFADGLQQVGLIARGGGELRAAPLAQAPEAAALTAR